MRLFQVDGTGSGGGGRRPGIGTDAPSVRPQNTPAQTNPNPASPASPRIQNAAASGNVADAGQQLGQMGQGSTAQMRPMTAQEVAQAQVPLHRSTFLKGLPKQISSQVPAGSIRELFQRLRSAHSPKQAQTILRQIRQRIEAQVPREGVNDRVRLAHLSAINDFQNFYVRGQEPLQEGWTRLEHAVQWSDARELETRIQTQGRDRVEERWQAYLLYRNLGERSAANAVLDGLIRYVREYRPPTPSSPHEQLSEGDRHAILVRAIEAKIEMGQAENLTFAMQDLETYIRQSYQQTNGEGRWEAHALLTEYARLNHAIRQHFQPAVVNTMMLTNPADTHRPANSPLPEWMNLARMTQELEGRISSEGSLASQSAHYFQLAAAQHQLGDEVGMITALGQAETLLRQAHQPESLIRSLVIHQYSELGLGAQLSSRVQGWMQADERRMQQANPQQRFEIFNDWIGMSAALYEVHQNNAAHEVMQNLQRHVGRYPFATQASLYNDLLNHLSQNGTTIPENLRAEILNFVRAGLQNSSATWRDHMAIREVLIRQSNDVAEIAASVQDLRSIAQGHGLSNSEELQVRNLIVRGLLRQRDLSHESSFGPLTMGPTGIRTAIAEYRMALSLVRQDLQSSNPQERESIIRQINSHYQELMQLTQDASSSFFYDDVQEQLRISQGNIPAQRLSIDQAQTLYDDYQDFLGTLPTSDRLDSLRRMMSSLVERSENVRLQDVFLPMYREITQGLPTSQRLQAMMSLAPILSEERNRLDAAIERSRPRYVGQQNADHDQLIQLRQNIVNQEVAMWNALGVATGTSPAVREFCNGMVQMAQGHPETSRRVLQGILNNAEFRNTQDPQTQGVLHMAYAAIGGDVQDRTSRILELVDGLANARQATWLQEGHTGEQAAIQRIRAELPRFLSTLPYDQLPATFEEALNRFAAVDAEHRQWVDEFSGALSRIPIQHEGSDAQRTGSVWNLIRAMDHLENPAQIRNALNALQGVLRDDVSWSAMSHEGRGDLGSALQDVALMLVQRVPHGDAQLRQDIFALRNEIPEAEEWGTWTRETFNARTAMEIALMAAAGYGATVVAEMAMARIVAGGFELAEGMTAEMVMAQRSSQLAARAALQRAGVALGDAELEGMLAQTLGAQARHRLLFYATRTAVHSTAFNAFNAPSSLMFSQHAPNVLRASLDMGVDTMINDALFGQVMQVLHVPPAMQRTVARSLMRQVLTRFGHRMERETVTLLRHAMTTSTFRLAQNIRHQATLQLFRGLSEHHRELEREHARLMRLHEQTGNAAFLQQAQRIEAEMRETVGEVDNSLRAWLGDFFRNVGQDAAERGMGLQAHGSAHENPAELEARRNQHVDDHVNARLRAAAEEHVDDGRTRIEIERRVNERFAEGGEERARVRARAQEEIDREMGAGHETPTSGPYRGMTRETMRTRRVEERERLLLETERETYRREQLATEREAYAARHPDRNRETLFFHSLAEQGLLDRHSFQNTQAILNHADAIHPPRIENGHPIRTEANQNYVRSLMEALNPNSISRHGPFVAEALRGAQGVADRLYPPSTRGERSAENLRVCDHVMNHVAPEFLREPERFVESLRQAREVLNHPNIRAQHPHLNNDQILMILISSSLPTAGSETSGRLESPVKLALGLAEGRIHLHDQTPAEMRPLTAQMFRDGNALAALGFFKVERASEVIRRAQPRVRSEARGVRREGLASLTPHPSPLTSPDVHFGMNAPQVHVGSLTPHEVRQSGTSTGETARTEQEQTALGFEAGGVQADAQGSGGERGGREGSGEREESQPGNLGNPSDAATRMNIFGEMNNAVDNPTIHQTEGMLPGRLERQMRGQGIDTGVSVESGGSVGSTTISRTFARTMTASDGASHPYTVQTVAPGSLRSPGNIAVIGRREGREVRVRVESAMASTEQTGALVISLVLEEAGKQGKATIILRPGSPQTLEVFSVETQAGRLPPGAGTVFLNWAALQAVSQGQNFRIARITNPKTILIALRSGLFAPGSHLTGVFVPPVTPSTTPFSLPVNADHLPNRLREEHVPRLFKDAQGRGGAVDIAMEGRPNPALLESEIERPGEHGRANGPGDNTAFASPHMMDEHIPGLAHSDSMDPTARMRERVEGRTGMPSIDNGQRDGGGEIRNNLPAILDVTSPEASAQRLSELAHETVFETQGVVRSLLLPLLPPLVFALMARGVSPEQIGRVLERLGVRVRRVSQTEREETTRQADEATRLPGRRERPILATAVFREGPVNPMEASRQLHERLNPAQEVSRDELCQDLERDFGITNAAESAYARDVIRDAVARAILDDNEHTAMELAQSAVSSILKRVIRAAGFANGSSRLAAVLVRQILDHAESPEQARDLAQRYLRFAEAVAREGRAALDERGKLLPEPLRFTEREETFQNLFESPVTAREAVARIEARNAERNERIAAGEAHAREINANNRVNERPHSPVEQLREAFRENNFRQFGNLARAHPECVNENNIRNLRRAVYLENENRAAAAYALVEMIENERLSPEHARLAALARDVFASADHRMKVLVRDAASRNREDHFLNGGAINHNPYDLSLRVSEHCEEVAQALIEEVMASPSDVALEYLIQRANEGDETARTLLQHAVFPRRAERNPQGVQRVLNAVILSGHEVVREAVQYSSRSGYVEAGHDVTVAHEGGVRVETPEQEAARLRNEQAEREAGDVEAQHAAPVQEARRAARRRGDGNQGFATPEMMGVAALGTLGISMMPRLMTMMAQGLPSTHQLLAMGGVAMMALAAGALRMLLRRDQAYVQQTGANEQRSTPRININHVNQTPQWTPGVPDNAYLAHVVRIFDPYLRASQGNVEPFRNDLERMIHFTQLPAILRLRLAQLAERMRRAESPPLIDRVLNEECQRTVAETEFVPALEILERTLERVDQVLEQERMLGRGAGESPVAEQAIPLTHPNLTFSFSDASRLSATEESRFHESMRPLPRFVREPLRDLWRTGLLRIEAVEALADDLPQLMRVATSMGIDPSASRRNAQFFDRLCIELASGTIPEFISEHAVFPERQIRRLIDDLRTESIATSGITPEEVALRNQRAAEEEVLEIEPLPDEVVPHHAIRPGVPSTIPHSIRIPANPVPDIASIDANAYRTVDLMNVVGAAEYREVRDFFNSFVGLLRMRLPSSEGAQRLAEQISSDIRLSGRLGDSMRPDKVERLSRLFRILQAAQGVPEGQMPRISDCAHEPLLEAVLRSWQAGILPSVVSTETVTASEVPLTPAREQAGTAPIRRPRAPAAETAQAARIENPLDASSVTNARAPAFKPGGTYISNEGPELGIPREVDGLVDPSARFTEPRSSVERPNAGGVIGGEPAMAQAARTETPLGASHEIHISDLLHLDEEQAPSRTKVPGIRQVDTVQFEDGVVALGLDVNGQAAPQATASNSNVWVERLPNGNLRVRNQGRENIVIQGPHQNVAVAPGASHEMDPGSDSLRVGSRRVIFDFLAARSAVPSATHETAPSTNQPLSLPRHFPSRIALMAAALTYGREALGNPLTFQEAASALGAGALLLLGGVALGVAGWMWQKGRQENAHRQQQPPAPPPPRVNLPPVERRNPVQQMPVVQIPPTIIPVDRTILPFTSQMNAESHPVLTEEIQRATREGRPVNMDRIMEEVLMPGIQEHFSESGDYAHLVTQGVDPRHLTGEDAIGRYQYTNDQGQAVTTVLVSDGMGGHGNGDIAAQLSLIAFSMELRRSGNEDRAWALANAAVNYFNLARSSSQGTPEEQSKLARRAAEEFIQRGEIPADLQAVPRGSGACSVSFTILPPHFPSQPHVLHTRFAGDAAVRVFRRGADGQWRRIYATREEGLGAMQADMQQVSAKRTMMIRLSDAANVVTNGLGTAHFRVRHTQEGEVATSEHEVRVAREYENGLALHEGDLVLGGSDGFWENFFSSAEIARLIHHCDSAAGAVRVLSVEAHRRMEVVRQLKAGLLPASPANPSRRMFERDGVTYYIDNQRRVYDSPQAQHPLTVFKADNFSLAAYLHAPSRQAQTQHHAAGPATILMNPRTLAADATFVDDTAATLPLRPAASRPISNQPMAQAAHVANPLDHSPATGARIPGFRPGGGVAQISSEESHEPGMPREIGGLPDPSAQFTEPFSSIARPNPGGVIGGEVPPMQGAARTAQNPLESRKMDPLLHTPENFVATGDLERRFPGTRLPTAQSVSSEGRSLWRVQSLVASPAWVEAYRRTTGNHSIPDAQVIPSGMFFALSHGALVTAVHDLLRRKGGNPENLTFLHAAEQVKYFRPARAGEALTVDIEMVGEGNGVHIENGVPNNRSVLKVKRVFRNTRGEVVAECVSTFQFRPNDQVFANPVRNFPSESSERNEGAVNSEQINRFAEVSGDHQWVHDATTVSAQGARNPYLHGMATFNIVERSLPGEANFPFEVNASFGLPVVLGDPLSVQVDPSGVLLAQVPGVAKPVARMVRRALTVSDIPSTTNVAQTASSTPLATGARMPGFRPGGGVPQISSEESHEPGMPREVDGLADPSARFTEPRSSVERPNAGGVIGGETPPTQGAARTAQNPLEGSHPALTIRDLLGHQAPGPVAPSPPSNRSNGRGPLEGIQYSCNQIEGRLNQRNASPELRRDFAALKARIEAVDPHDKAAIRALNQELRTFSQRVARQTESNLNDEIRQNMDLLQNPRHCKEGHAILSPEQRRLIESHLRSRDETVIIAEAIKAIVNQAANNNIKAYGQLLGLLFELSRIRLAEERAFPFADLPPGIRSFRYSTGEVDSNTNRPIEREISNDVGVVPWTIWEVKAYHFNRYGDANSRQQLLNYERLIGDPAFRSNLGVADYGVGVVEVSGMIHPDLLTWAQANCPHIEFLYTFRISDTHELSFALNEARPFDAATPRPSLRRLHPSTPLNSREQQILRGVHRLQQEGRLVPEVLSRRLLTAEDVNASNLSPEHKTALLGMVGIDGRVNPRDCRSIPLLQEYLRLVEMKRQQIFFEAGAAVAPETNVDYLWQGFFDQREAVVRAEENQHLQNRNNVRNIEADDDLAFINTMPSMPAVRPPRSPEIEAWYGSEVEPILSSSRSPQQKANAIASLIRESRTAPSWEQCREAMDAIRHVPGLSENDRIVSLTDVVMQESVPVPVVQEFLDEVDRNPRLSPRAYAEAHYMIQVNHPAYRRQRVMEIYGEYRSAFSDDPLMMQALDSWEHSEPRVGNLYNHILLQLVRDEMLTRGMPVDVSWLQTDLGFTMFEAYPHQMVPVEVLRGFARALVDFKRADRYTARDPLMPFLQIPVSGHVHFFLGRRPNLTDTLRSVSANFATYPRVLGEFAGPLFEDRVRLRSRMNTEEGPVYLQIARGRYEYNTGIEMTLTGTDDAFRPDSFFAKAGIHLQNQEDGSVVLQVVNIQGPYRDEKGPHAMEHEARQALLGETNATRVLMANVLLMAENLRTRGVNVGRIDIIHAEAQMGYQDQLRNNPLREDQRRMAPYTELAQRFGFQTRRGHQDFSSLDMTALSRQDVMHRINEALGDEGAETFWRTIAPAFEQVATVRGLRTGGNVRTREQPFHTPETEAIHREGLAELRRTRVEQQTQVRRNAEERHQRSIEQNQASAVRSRNWLLAHPNQNTYRTIVALGRIQNPDSSTAHDFHQFVEARLRTEGYTVERRGENEDCELHILREGSEVAVLRRRFSAEGGFRRMTWVSHRGDTETSNRILEIEAEFSRERQMYVDANFTRKPQDRELFERHYPGSITGLARERAFALAGTQLVREGVPPLRPSSRPAQSRQARMSEVPMAARTSHPLDSGQELELNLNPANLSVEGATNVVTSAPNQRRRAGIFAAGALVLLGAIARLTEAFSANASSHANSHPTTEHTTTPSQPSSSENNRTLDVASFTNLSLEANQQYSLSLGRREISQLSVRSDTALQVRDQGSFRTWIQRAQERHFDRPVPGLECELHEGDVLVLGASPQDGNAQRFEVRRVDGVWNLMRILSPNTSPTSQAEPSRTPTHRH